MSATDNPDQAIRRGIVKELKKTAWKSLRRVEDYVNDGEWDKAIGALGTIEYVCKAAKEWNTT